MNSYLRRFVKFFLFLVMFIFLLLIVLPRITRGESFEQSLADLYGNGRIRILLILVFLYTLIYPYLNFGKKDRPIKGSFAGNRPVIEKTMEELGYVKKTEEGSRLVFRKRIAFSRIMMLGEDRVEIETNGNPLIFEGPKRDLKRIETELDLKLLKES